ncbi:MAG: hypothetical protein A2234_00760 [Elusimicrobia bacterium RIFOXYA2_FULL_58_8]|nr:MAG: hypothetical protein A2285_06120 [Elusimicrobia bacterium RIFOXYA12_FULL_57_11]OGS12209.1 MAG: hypothetical protein A2234_00760 [Elusimicrobia bacterium RIFOXYA2_FULL_58_8]
MLATLIVVSYLHYRAKNPTPIAGKSEPAQQVSQDPAAQDALQQWTLPSDLSYQEKSAGLSSRMEGANDWLVDYKAAEKEQQRLLAESDKNKADPLRKVKAGEQ